MKVQDVTSEYLVSATPGKGTITYDSNYKISRHHEEIAMAAWLRGNFGGDIRLLNESDVFGVKMPDYRWRNKLWELKSLTTAKAADSAVRHGLKQIQGNPGGIILDYGTNEVSLDELQSILISRIKRAGVTTVDIIVHKDREIKVFRYKK